MTRTILLPLLAIACTAPPQQPPGDPADAPQERGTGKACDAARAKALIGRSRSAATEAEARRLTGAPAIRWVPHGAMVTMDYRPDRLNIRLGKDGRVASLDCG
jgi:hypothetical protein